METYVLFIAMICVSLLDSYVYFAYRELVFIHKNIYVHLLNDFSHSRDGFVQTSLILSPIVSSGIHLQRGEANNHYSKMTCPVVVGK